MGAMGSSSSSRVIGWVLARAGGALRGVTAGDSGHHGEKENGNSEIIMLKTGGNLVQENSCLLVIYLLDCEMQKIMIKIRRQYGVRTVIRNNKFPHVFRR